MTHSDEHRTCRILVLDSDSHLRGEYAATLSQPETSDDGLIYDLTLVDSGERAVATVAESLEQGRPFSMAVVDVRPDAAPDGVDTAERIRRQDPEVEIVALGGDSEAPLEEINRRVPPCHKLMYLEKPLSGRVLRQTALSLCAKWRSRVESTRLTEDLAREMEERINAQRDMEDQFRQVQKMEALGTLAGGIAHDFNNILGVMMGYAEIIADDAGEDEMLTRRIQQILLAGRRARDLIDQILNFSRQTPQERKSTHLATQIDEAMKIIRASTPSTVSVEVANRCQDDLATVDPSQFQQIVMNLCSNAVQALAEDGGTILVEIDDVADDDPNAAGLDSPEWYLRLTVADNGPGVPKDVQDRIFDPFFTTKPPGQGTGIGLSVVHGIVKNHEGLVVLDSEPGQGAAFHVYLPRARRPVGATPEPAAVFVPDHGRVLFVDDEKPLVDIGREMLVELGFEVVARTSSVEALEAFRNRPESYDMVITDYSMPNMTGLQLARELLKLRPGLPILLCTGFSEAVSKDRVRALGISDLIMKPILKSKLIESVSRLLDGKNGGKNDGKNGGQGESAPAKAHPNR